MKIAIHNRQKSFSDRWILYCQKNNVPYKLVNCYDSSIVQQLSDCDGLMWHWSQEDYRAQNFARQLIFALEKKGLKVYPNFNTCYHFDDKVGQKYLFEAINANLPNSTIFYDKKEAFKWINKTSFPKVFKLRGGAASMNVKLINNKKAALKITRKAFGKGYPLYSNYSFLKQRIWELRRDKTGHAVINLLKKVIKPFLLKDERGLLSRQIGYVYFQDFIPNNQFDDRIIVIGERVLAIRRYNRQNDFRASGSGMFNHDHKLFSNITIKTSFEIAKQLDSQSLALDFVYDDKGCPIIIEMSYGFPMGSAVDNCPGYWDCELNWHDDNVDPQRYIIEDFIALLSEGQ